MEMLLAQHLLFAYFLQRVLCAPLTMLWMDAIVEFIIFAVCDVITIGAVATAMEMAPMRVFEGQDSGLLLLPESFMHS